MNFLKTSVAIIFLLLVQSCIDPNTAPSSPVKEKVENPPKNRLIDKRDGQEYATVLINGTTWMAENLRYNSSNSWCYNDHPSNCQLLGRLYTWQAAREACPEGWRLPNDKEWKALGMAFGGYAIYLTDKVEGDPLTAYKRLIAGGDSGFNGVLAGARFPDDEYYNGLEGGFYWSSDEVNEVQGSNFSFSIKPYKFYFRNTLVQDKKSGFSCRCVAY